MRRKSVAAQNFSGCLQGDEGKEGVASFSKENPTGTRGYVKD